ncbi:MAG: DUF3467 domain-containing protein [Pseudomonadota bacterium]
MSELNSSMPTTAEEAVPATGEAQPTNARIIWDDSNMDETFANVATVLATQEEFSILFGTQRGLRPDPSGMHVKLRSRAIVNPFLAKRLLGVLSRTIDEYERRFGEISVESASGE